MYASTDLLLILSSMRCHWTAQRACWQSSQCVVESRHTGEVVIRVELVQPGGLDGPDFFPPQTAERKSGSTWGLCRGTSSGSSAKRRKDSSGFSFIESALDSQNLTAFLLRARREPFPLMHKLLGSKGSRDELSGQIVLCRSGVTLCRRLGGEG